MHPILFNLGPITVYSYGLMLAIGFLAGIALALKRAPKYNLPNKDDILDISILTIAAAIIGSRLLYVLINWPEYASNPIRILFFNEGGLVFFGGLLGVIITGIPFIIIRKLPVSRILDCCAPSIGVGHFFGRLGCFLNGCCYGRETASSIGVIFPSTGDSIPRHPTQIYESLFTISLASFILWIDKDTNKFRKKIGEGGLFALYIFIYSAGRICIELFRGDPRGSLGMLSTSQLIGAALLLASGGFLAYRIRGHNGSESKS